MFKLFAVALFVSGEIVTFDLKVLFDNLTTCLRAEHNYPEIIARKKILENTDISSTLKSVEIVCFRNPGLVE